MSVPTGKAGHRRPGKMPVDPKHSDSTVQPPTPAEESASPEVMVARAPSKAAPNPALKMRDARQKQRKVEEVKRVGGEVHYAQCTQPRCLGPGVWIHRDDPMGPLKSNEWEATYKPIDQPWASDKGIPCQCCYEASETKMLSYLTMLRYGSGQFGPYKRVVRSMSIEEYCEMSGITRKDYDTKYGKHRWPKAVRETVTK